ncbi:hypothetical protein ACHAWT_005646 [Skeletonema menzelii]
MSTVPPITGAAPAAANPLRDDAAMGAVPTLKVMRLQAGILGSPTAGALLSSNQLLSSNLLLPDSFGVIHVGETFSAYLGVLNASNDLSVRGLSMVAQLQTPSRRILLPTALDARNNNNNSSLREVAPGEGVDALISRRLEEVGQHILRVEVSYNSNGAKTLRKFYRFNVTDPLQITTESVTRSGDATCLVSINIENVMEKQGVTGGAVAISSIGFDAADGLSAKQINVEDESDTDDPVQNITQRQSALELYDKTVILQPGDSYQYLFSVNAESEAAALRGIACGDELGKACVVFQKTMGELGKIYSSPVMCPPTAFLKEDGSQNSKFVVNGSGLSVDVAAASAQRSSSSGKGNGSLDELLPVTVEPIDPPSTMRLSAPENISLLVVNHSSQAMNLQIQMRLSRMSGVVVCGPSFITLGSVPPSGGSCTVDFRLVALVAGLFSVSGCFVVDLTTGMEVEQPVLFDVFAKLPADVSEEEEKKENLL